MDTSKPSLLIACPASWGLRRSETGDWLSSLAYYLGQGREFPYGNVGFCSPRGRIEVFRNQTVAEAKARGYTHLLMVDPDMVCDAYVGHDPRAVPWWHAAWAWLQSHPLDVIGVAARGKGPDYPVQVFHRVDGELRRWTDEEAIHADGWHRVGAMGSGLLFCRTSVFDALDPPYFADRFWDSRHEDVLFTQDVQFCNNCAEHAVGLWVNFSCWCAHVQDETVDKPFWDANENRSLVEAVPDS